MDILLVLPRCQCSALDFQLLVLGRQNGCSGQVSRLAKCLLRLDVTYWNLKAGRSKHLVKSFVRGSQPLGDA